MAKKPLEDSPSDGILEHDRLQEIQYGVSPWIAAELVAEDGLIQERYWKQLEGMGWPRMLKAVAQNPYWQYDASLKTFNWAGDHVKFTVAVKDEKK